MRSLITGCAIGASLTLTSAASASTFTKTATKDGKTIVVLEGEISSGDSNTLKTIIKSENGAGRVVYAVRLNSDGGNLAEGV